MNYPSAPRERARFEQRFYAGHSSTVTTESGPGFVERLCGDCGNATMGYADELHPRCFPCGNSHNPFAQKAIRMSVDATGEDSTNPQRIKDGTAGFNIGMRGVDTVIGKNPDGTNKLSYRPLANNEISSARALKEQAKRAGLTPQDTQKRAVGGRG